MKQERRSEIMMEDLNLYEPDTSADMFYGKHVVKFKAPDGREIAFVYRRIDPGTLLELTDQALLAAASDEPELDDDGNPLPEDIAEITPLAELRMARVSLLHRLEVLQKCIVMPTFKNLDQIKHIPSEWQSSLYSLIMNNSIGGDCLTAVRFPEEN